MEEAGKHWEWGGCSAGVQVSSFNQSLIRIPFQHGITTSRKMLTRTSGGTNSALRKLEKHNLKAGRLVSYR